MLYGTGRYTFFALVLSVVSTALNVLVILDFLPGSYDMLFISNDILGNVIATAFDNSACCSNFAKNFCLGP